MNGKNCFSLVCLFVSWIVSGWASSDALANWHVLTTDISSVNIEALQKRLVDERANRKTIQRASQPTVHYTCSGVNAFHTLLAAGNEVRGNFGPGPAGNVLVIHDLDNYFSMEMHDTDVRGYLATVLKEGRRHNQIVVIVHKGKVPSWVTAALDGR